MEVADINIVPIRAVFVTQGISTVKLSKDHSEYKWCTPFEAVKNLKLIPGIKEVLQNL